MTYAGPIVRLSISLCDLNDQKQIIDIEQYIFNNAQGAPFHRPAWLQAVAQATGHRPCMLVARTDEGLINGIIPFNEVHSILFGHAMISSAFAVGGGILAQDEYVAESLAQALWELAQEAGCSTVELRGGALPGASWRSQDNAHLSFQRPLAADTDHELASIPRKHRAELRKALANPALRVEHGISEALLRDHYRVYSESVRNLGTPVFPAQLFREMASAFGKDADITVIYHHDRPVSAVFTFYHQGTCMPYWGGGVKAARHLRSNELLYFRLMDHARAKGCIMFDFGRSKVGSGHAKWKQSWGFVPQPLTYYIKDASGAGRDINPDSAKYQARIRLWKKLPLTVANFIGPLVSRGLG